MEIQKFATYSEDETIELGKKFAEQLKPGDVVAFYGDLGSGKTEFIKGICNFFNVEEIVTSPTFTIMNKYSGELDENVLSIYHIDLYRIKSLDELDEIGFDECVHSEDSIKLIEWASKADGDLPDKSYKIIINLHDENEDERSFEISH